MPVKCGGNLPARYPGNGLFFDVSFGVKLVKKLKQGWMNLSCPLFGNAPVPQAQHIPRNSATANGGICMGKDGRRAS
jgi:hypothetical protein